jgi:hypothetical protein
MYQYVFIRTDIPYVNQVVQACHACTIAGKEFAHPEDTNLVLLQVRNEKELQRVAKWLTRVKIGFKMFYEPDYPVGNTAICTEAVEDCVKPLFRKYQVRKISLVEFAKGLIPHDDPVG